MRRRSGSIIGVAGCLLAGAAPVAALATPPLEGATYRGALSAPHASVTISFRVSSAGAVSGLRLSSLPIYCSGSPPPGTPTIVFGPARVSAGGSFSGTGRDVIASSRLKGSVVATFALSGTFSSGGRERGMLATTYTGAARACSGRSAYSTRG